MDPNKISYYNEISMMMYGFGDSHKPNPETVRLVENIVLSQLRMIIQEALKYCNGKNLRGEELIFLMRKNKYKMKRFVQYLMVKDAKKMLESQTIDLTNPPKNKLIDFIERIDETGEFTDMTDVDETKYERNLRADRISVALGEAEYIKFSKARRASFHSKQMTQLNNFEKFRVWVDPKRDVNINQTAMDVLTYYAYETVAQLVDYAILVRLDMKSTMDPLNNLAGSSYNAAMFNGDYRFTGKNADYSKVYSGQPAISVAEIKEVMRRIYMPPSNALILGKQKLPDTRYIIVL